MVDEFIDSHGLWRVVEELPNGVKRYALVEPAESEEKKSVKKNASTKKGNKSE